MLAILLALMAPLQAQPSDWHPNDLSNLDVGLRVTGLGGQIDGEEDWNDFFGAGVGLGVGYSHLWKVSPVAHLGVYGRLSFDRFSGDKADLSDPTIGTLIFDQDDMTLLKGIVGFKIRESFKAFFLEQNLGIGFVNYSAVDSDITDDLGTFSAEIIAGSTEFAYEVGLTAGFYLGKQPNSPTVYMTFAHEGNGAPEVGDDFQDLVDTEAQKNFVWTIGASFSF